MTAMLQPNARTSTVPPKREDLVAARAAKKAVLLEEAAQEFNARGISGASIGRIARRMGLTRAAVYYYVKERDELAAQCYRRTCALMQDDLEAAQALKADGLVKVLAFLRLSLDPKRAPVAALSELDYLEGPTRSAITAAHAKNVAVLRALIRGGIEDGSIRLCDDEIITQTLIGTITWIPLSVDWVEGTDETFRARTVDALADIIVNGHASDRDFRFTSPIAIESFFPEPPNAFDRRANSAAKIERLLMTASQLFNRRGIDGTSLDDITNALGATKGALYHYLDNKTDLVVRCYKRAFALYERFADASDAKGRSGFERALIGVYLNVQAHTCGLSPLIQMVGSAALPPGARRDITRRARALQRRFEGFGKQGLADKSFRALDFDAVAQLGAGTFQWLPKWFSTDDPRASGALASEVVDLFIKGLRPR
ncbi:MAG: TetR/AcrR family transcriptional regulator [Proteobacteria bacterium]|nr:TetR/AcrR family transcriptional regulator [Pseudomonadota bacterium]